MTRSKIVGGRFQTGNMQRRWLDIEDTPQGRRMNIKEYEEYEEYEESTGVRES